MVNKKGTLKLETNLLDKPRNGPKEMSQFCDLGFTLVVAHSVVSEWDFTSSMISQIHHDDV